MRYPNRMITLLLLCAMVLVTSGCRMRIIDSPVADIVMEQTEKPEPTATPEPTPTPESEQEPTPTPQASPSPNPETVPTANPEDTQPTQSGTVQILTPDEAGTVIQSDEKIIVTLDPNRGSCGKESIEVSQGGVYGNLPDAERRGYHFTGWYLTRNGGTRITEDTIVTITEAHTLYAHWSVSEKHMLTLDPQGGRLLRSELTREIYPGETYGALPTPDNPGYDFIGWFTAPNGGQPVSANDVFAENQDQTLYAAWEYNPFAYWSFVLQNTNEALYACQKVSVYLEYDEAGVTPGYSGLIADTSSYNVATNLGGGVVDDDWIREKNANVLVKCVSDMGAASGYYAEMQERFPGKRILILSSAAEYGSAAQQLYYRLYLAQLLYPDWYAGMNIATVGAELGVSGTIYGS